MLEAEFDRFAQNYRESHAASIRLSGETPEFFAQSKVADVQTQLRGGSPPRILDFGAGVGNAIGPLRAAFPSSVIVALDPSAQSLAIAARRFPGQAEFQPFDGETIPYADGSFDLVFAACVFHHIPEALQPGLLRELRRVMAPGASIFVFEHNPWNPLTRHAVRRCAFDENAVLISAPELRRRMADAGHEAPRVTFRTFFPRALATLRPLERRLGGLPLGAQYFVRSVARQA